MSTVRVERDEVIACQPEQAFERATDLARYAEWMPRTGVFKSCSHISDDPVRLGTTYVDRGRMGAFQGGSSSSIGRRVWSIARRCAGLARSPLMSL
jgi:hypothetical protein